MNSLFEREFDLIFPQLFLITIKTVHRSSIELNFQLIFNGMVNGYCKNSIFETFILSLNVFQFFFESLSREDEYLECYFVQQHAFQIPFYTGNLVMINTRDLFTLFRNSYSYIYPQRYIMVLFLY